MLEHLRAREGEHGLQRGQGGRAGIAGGVDGAVDSEVAQQGQQAEDAGSGLAWEALAVEGVQQGRGGGFQGDGSLGLALGLRASRQAGEAFFLEDPVDGALGWEPPRWRRRGGP